MEKFTITLSDEADATIAKLKKTDQVKSKKVTRTIKRLATEGPKHSGLRTHRFGGDIWQSYVENNTPSAWRIWWKFGAKGGREIIITKIGAHP